MKNPYVKHGIHTAIVLAVLLLGSTLFPQFFHFNTAFAILPTTIVFMVIYVLSNDFIADLACKANFESYTSIYAFFLIMDVVPGFIALLLMATVYHEFWMSTPWLVALVLSVICEVIYAMGALFMTYEGLKE